MMAKSSDASNTAVSLICVVGKIPRNGSMILAAAL